MAQTAPPGLTEMPLEIPAYLIESVPARGQVDAVSQHPGEFIYASGDQVYLGNTVRGTSSLFTADAGYELMGVDSTFSDSGPLNGWAEGMYDDQTGRAPCADEGAITWRLFANNGLQTHLITSGVNSRVRLCTAAQPLFAFDGNEVAYADEAPRGGHPDAWQIHVVNVLTDESMRVIDTDEDIFSLDFDGGVIAYTEGTFDPAVDPNFEFGTRLMLAPADDQTPHEIAADAYHVSLFDGRLAWVADQSASQRDENAPGPQVMTATLSDLSPRSLGALNGLPPRWPVAGGDFITWVEAGEIVLAAPNDGVQWRLSGTGHADSAWASSGFESLDWLVLNEDGSQALDRIPLAKALPALPEPSEPPSPAPTATLTPPATPTPSPTSSSLPTTVVQLPPAALRTVPVRASYPFAQYGPLVAYTANTGVELVDLEHLTTTEIFALGRDEVTGSLAMSSGAVVWTIDKYDRYGGPDASCSVQGGLTWRIVAHIVATGKETVVATGRHVDVRVCAAASPPIAIDGDHVAYGREGSPGGGWTITVQSLTTGKVLRSIDTAGEVSDIGLDGLDVAYVETSWPSNHLMLSTAAHPEAVAIMKAVDGISFSDGRLAWVALPPNSWGECWTATLTSPTPVRISSDDIQRILDPRTADGFVAYATSTGQSGIRVWDERTGTSYELGSDLWADDVMVGGGWLAWYNDPDESPAVIQGLPLSEVPGLGQ